MFTIKRDPHNPLLQPDRHTPWESRAVFNWSPIKKGSKLVVLYRGESTPDLLKDNKVISLIGRAESYNGKTFSYRDPYIVPDQSWDQHGCEDPRTTFFEGKYYTFYTALGTYPFSPEGIKVGLAISDDLTQVQEKHLITPFNAKAMTLFPERIGGKITALLTVHPDVKPAKIALFQCNTIEELRSEDIWNTWIKDIDSHTLSLTRKEKDHVEIGAVPIKTDRGWLLIYSHIQQYTTDKPVFGIEAVLLDHDNPQKVRARTHYPFMVPQEFYEQFGHVPNVIFPSGALTEGDELSIYYGAADTTCCRASLSLHDLLEYLYPKRKEKIVERAQKHPILKPRKKGGWEDRCVFNPAAIELKGSIHILYRAMSQDNTSTIGYARSKDGVTIDYRHPTPIYIPRESFESKKHDPQGNSGCEDPRITLIDKHLYMLYTAYDQEIPRVAVSSISVHDFLKEEWNWSTPHLISPENVDDKDACLFPEKIHNRYLIIHRVKSHVCADYLHTLEFEKEKVDTCIVMFGPRPGMWDSLKVGIACPPIKTPKGWLIFYHGVSDDRVYQVGAVLTDLEEPTSIIARTEAPIFGPELKWEQEGEIPQVVFPCGAVLQNNTIYLYYGGADKVVGVAKVAYKRLLEILTVQG